MLKYAMLDPNNIIVGIGDSPTEAENNAYYNSNAPQMYGSYPTWLQYSNLIMWRITPDALNCARGDLNFDNKQKLISKKDKQQM